ncbi:extracellular solute-binding protein [Eisenbergiella tayi]|uniref:extracellular solute-binding protein n=1 Tax=Eisenbergiella tayi TaxID=1432052 RepID=UPI000848EA09|nr:extracellular solute-binding protein [Eisenbergiella tayi]ODR28291.1 hypothetical protein BEI60_31160 [Eisenbergiella tayi]
MKRKVTKRLFAVALSVTMLLSGVGCGSKSTSQPSEGNNATETSSNNESSVSETSEKNASGDITKITLYPHDATTTSGIVDGYKGELYAEHGIQLDIWAYSDEKTNAILASGDLPDVMYVDYDDLTTLIEGGLVLNLEQYLDKMPHIAKDDTIQTALNYTREFRSGGTGEIYGIPIGIGVQEAIWDDPGANCVKINWDIYHELGCPQVDSLEGLIPLMKDMMEARPTAEDGTKNYGVLLNSGSDGTYWGNMRQWFKWNGYEPDSLQYLVEMDMINGKFNSILESNRDSLYYKGLKWFNTAYREGVLDPDSINSDYMTQKAKIDKSMACMVPGGSVQGYAGYMPIYIPGQQIYHEHWTSTYGKDSYLVINANTDHLDACLEFLDTLADMDFYFLLWNGREEDGLWEHREDGLVYPTEYGLESAIGSATKGEETIFTNGEKQALWNDNFIVSKSFSESFIGPNGPREARTLQGWDEVTAVTSDTEINRQWREQYGYHSYMDQLRDKNAFTLDSVLTDVTSFCSTPDDSLQLTVDAIRDVVVSSSWKMVYAENDNDFEALWDQMIQDCKDLGAEEIVQWRMDELSKGIEIKNKLQAD